MVPGQVQGGGETFHFSFQLHPEDGDNEMDLCMISAYDLNDWVFLPTMNFQYALGMDMIFPHPMEVSRMQ